jgi:PAS domain S-box-containing protein
MSQVRILVVEDERIVALDLQARLQDLGYVVPATAARGEDAVRRALELHPDLILMDIRLKGEMDGIEAARRIQEQLEVPVIYLTAYADPETLDRAKVTGPYGYLLKPFEDRELQTTIQIALYKHRTDAALKAQAEELSRLNAAINQVAEGVVITDVEGDIVYANPAFERATGHCVQEAIGQNAVILNRSQDDGGSAARLRATLRGGGVWQGRLNNRRKDGSSYVSEGSISPVRDEEGHVTNYVAVQRDVTQELQMEEEYREALKMEAVGRLAAGIAHDFNNMLTAINGYASLVLGNMPPQDPDQDMVQAILGAGERAADLVRQLLTFARKEVVESEVLNLNDTVDALSGILRRSVGEHVELRTDLSPDLWAVKADATQIDRIVVNLAVNARDAMPDGGTLTLRTRNVVLREDGASGDLEARHGDYVVLSVSDTGVGMSEDVQAHIFEPFFTTKELGRGTGLGLATVYGIVKQSGGWLQVDSAEGQGATFEIYLPRCVELAAQQVDWTVEEDFEPGSETILLVEDDDVVREVAGAVLESQGYTVLLAADAEAASQEAAKHTGSIDLLLTDVIMPGTSGPKLAMQLSQRSTQLKVLFMSGYPDDEIQRHAGGQIDVDLLSKPFQTVDLATKVRAVLAR